MVWRCRKTELCGASISGLALSAVSSMKKPRILLWRILSDLTPVVPMYFASSSVMIAAAVVAQSQRLVEIGPKAGTHEAAVAP